METDWDTALDITADKLVEIYKRDGPDAMAVYCCAKATNEDNYLLQKMWRSLFRTNNVTIVRVYVMRVQSSRCKKRSAPRR